MKYARLVIAFVIAAVSSSALVITLDAPSLTAMGQGGSGRPTKRPRRLRPTPATQTAAANAGKAPDNSKKTTAKTRPRLSGSPNSSNRGGDQSENSSPEFNNSNRDSATPVASAPPTSTPQGPPPDALLLPKDFLARDWDRNNWFYERQPKLCLKTNPYPVVSETPRRYESAPIYLPTPDRRPLPTPPPGAKIRLGDPRYPMPKMEFPTPNPFPIPRSTPTVGDTRITELYEPCATPTPSLGLTRIFGGVLDDSRKTDQVGDGKFGSLLSLPVENPYKAVNTNGEFSEIKGKVSVFVNATGLAGEKINMRLTEFGGPRISLSSQDAEFAINYFTWLDGSKGGTLIVTIRDPKEKLPRILWREYDVKNSDAFDRLTKRFLSDLKQLLRQK